MVQVCFILLSCWEPKPKNVSQSLNMVHFHFTLSLSAHRLRDWILILHGKAFGWFSKAFIFSCSWLLVCVESDP
jgi:hypothetical protein